MKRSAVIAAAAFIALIVCGLIAAPFLGNPNTIDEAHWTGRPLAPCFQDAAHCAGHLLGTDENGRDLLSRLTFGMQATLGIALLALCFELILAALLAAFVRRCGSVVDWSAGRIAEGISALPRLPLVFVFVVVFNTMQHNTGKAFAGPGIALFAVWYASLLWPRAFLLFRARVGWPQVLSRALSDLTTIILLDATVNFFGYGIQPPSPSWGNMLADAESNLEVAWWASVFPGLCIFVTVLLLEVTRRGITDSAQHPVFVERPLSFSQ